MKKNTRRNALMSLLGFMLLASCQKKEAKIDKDEFVNKPYSDSIVKFEFEFPDTVYVNKLYNGKIKYEGIFDTIITTFGDKKKNRYIRFMMAKTHVIDFDDKHLKQIAKDTFGAIDNRTIPFYDVKFTKLGTNYIVGIINDNVLIDTVAKDKNGKDLVRYVEREVRATHKVVVIERPEGKI